MDVLMDKLTEDFLRPYSGAQVSQLMTLALEMETFGLTAADVIVICGGYFAALSAAQDVSQIAVSRAMVPQRPAGPPAAVPCPVCGRPLKISPVNVSKCTNVGGAWRTSLMCSGDTCRFTELSTENLDHWRVKSGI